MSNAVIQGRVIEYPKDYPVQPRDIDASEHLIEAFDHLETEISAGWLVRFCQTRGGSWEPLTRKDIEAYYRSRGLKDGFTFNRLIEPGRAFYIQTGWTDKGGGWIVERDGKLHFTDAFVLACYKSRPVATEVPANA